MRPEHRRSPRIAARLWIEVAAVDERPVLRTANVSLTGIFFETDREIGPPGSLQRLRVSSFSRQRTVIIMGRVVRVVTANDLWQGRRIKGIGLEFLVEAPSTRQDLQVLIQELVETRDLGEGQSPADFLRLRDDPLDAGAGIRLDRIDRRGMLIETDWPVTTGETIRCEIQAPASGRHLRIEGRAVTSTPLNHDDRRFRVEVAFETAVPQRPTPHEVPVQGDTLDDAMTVLLEETLVTREEDARPPGHPRSLTGSLDRIQLTSLLAFIEMERMTGVLNVCRGADEARVVLHGGRALNVISDTLAGEPFALLRQVFSWADGDFVFSEEVVPEEDVLETTTTGLILELARLRDEELYGNGT